MDTIGLGQRIWVLTADEMSADSTLLVQIFLTDITLGPGWVNKYSLRYHPTHILKDAETGNMVLQGESDQQLLILDKYGEKVEEEEVPDQPEEEKEEEPKDDGGN